MPRGGMRPGTGGARPGAGRPRKQPPPAVLVPRPVFRSGEEFALWALNAPDAEVSIAQKIKIAIALLSLETRRSAHGGKSPPNGPASPATGIYRPRRVRPFEVIDGDR